MSVISRVKRPLLLALFVTVAAVGLAKAMGYYTGATMPVGECTSVVCSVPTCTVDACATVEPATTCGPVCNNIGIARTNLPGWYSNDYDYSITSQQDLGITYLIPTGNGFMETNRIPLTNPVDQYYATHKVINGEVVDITNMDNRGSLAARN